MKDSHTDEVRMYSVDRFPIDESALDPGLGSQILPSGYLKHGKRWAKSSINGDHGTEFNFA